MNSLVLISLFLLSGFTQNGVNITPSERETVVEGVVILKFKNDNMPGPLDQLPIKKEILVKYGIHQYQPVLKNFPRLQKSSYFRPLNSIFELHYESGLTPQELAAELSQIPEVEYAEPKYIHFIDQQPQFLPNDSLYGQQSYLPVVSAPEGWVLSRGEQGNTIIAVIDGGTEIRHPDLQENVWINEGEIPGDSLDNDGNGWVDDVYGWNFINNSGDPTGLSTTPGNANHGTHVAGVIGAVSDNGRGISGISWNARIMAVNAGSAFKDDAISYGYDGILYAVQNGARVINCSWGRSGAASQYEQDVMNGVTASGALVVASAGNDGNNLPHFPSSYKNVLSVAATDNNDNRANFSNFGPDVDISAPGVFILSTLRNGSYGPLSGTSFSSPLVAGAVGLVLTRFPELLPQQGGEQIRVTADYIDDKNPLYAYGLGKGRLNVFRALTENQPAVRIADMEYSDTDQDSLIERGETITVSLSVKNFLSPVSNLSMVLSTPDPYVTLLTSETSISYMATFEEQTPATPFRFAVSESAPIGHVVHFRLDMNSGDYSDFDNFKLTILPTFTTVSVNNISLTVTNVGRIGTADFSDPEKGIGFRYKNGPNLLFEGAIIAGTGPQRISNAARSTGNETDADFRVTEDGNLQVLMPGQISTQETTGKFDDRNADNPLQLKIVQETYASDKNGRQDFIIFRYIVENENNVSINNFHLGLFFDWDLDGETYATNRVEFDNQLNMGYVYDTNAGPDAYIGMLALSPGALSFRAIYNDQDDPNNPSWGLYDGYTDAEKWESISGGLTNPTAGPADISAVIGLGPYTIDAGQELDLGFALVGGDNLDALKLHADSTANLWREIFYKIPPDTVIPRVFKLNQNYPNPFNTKTRIEYSAPPEQGVTITVFNILGEKIITLLDQSHGTNGMYVEWDGTDAKGNSVAGGLYFYRMESGGKVFMRKMLYLK